MVFVKTSLILFVALFIFAGSARAQTTTITQALPDEETMSSDPAMLDDVVGETEEIEESASEYTLPYPGMLPNNPLYFLKSLRDSFIGFIISDPLKKAEFELLQADKKLAAAEFLLKEEAENTEFALRSVKESASHFQVALDKLTQTDLKSADSQSVFQKMAASLGKHDEVLTELSQTTRNEAFTQYAQSASELKEKVESFL